jgi:hypothetical protein
VDGVPSPLHPRRNLRPQRARLCMWVRITPAGARPIFGFARRWWPAGSVETQAVRIWPTPLAAPQGTISSFGE